MSKNNIILIGFMGSGKSAIGKALKNISGFQLVDTDTLLEQRLKTTINDIFETKGEPFFREQETVTLESIQNIEKSIISTGGGIVLKPKNTAILKELGKVFWLNVSAETVLKRVQEDNNRPLLASPNRFQIITDLLAKRHNNYKNASDYEIDTNYKNIEEISKEIWKIYNQDTCKPA
ncbi:shikimate kinase [Candidatus Margulisiibacteriota bacterium]